MAYSRLYIFVEGSDDDRFFYSLIAPLFKRHFNDVEVLKYAQWKKSKIIKFIESIKTLEFDYIFTGDIDQCDFANEKKRILKEKYPGLDYNKIDIVIAEIESWYYAGLTREFIEEHNLSDPPNTNQMTKEDFNQTYNNRFRSRYDFMAEIVSQYSFEIAIEKNKSLRMFLEKYKL
jgi:hypothetical protein